MSSFEKSIYSVTDDNVSTQAIEQTPTKVTPFSFRVVLIYGVCFINFVSLAVTLVSALSIVNLSINGDANTNSSASALVNTTVYFLINVTDLIFAKYNSSLSDYVGRKPMLLVSQLALLISRVLILVRQDTSTFYTAAIIFGFGNYFYNVCLAWLCDILAEEDRGKAFGLLIGISIGLGFTIGLPIGAVLSISDPFLPIKISIFLSVFNCVFIISLPVDDTLASKSRQIARSDKPMMNIQNICSYNISFLRHRSLPDNISEYLIEHSIYGAFKIVNSAKCRQDWISFFFFQIAQQVLQLTFILFGIQVFLWTTSEAGIALAFVGITIAVVSPIFLGRYTEISMISLGSVLQCIGYVLLAICGAGVGLAVVDGLGYLSLFLLAFGGLWISSLQALILGHYSEERQGEAAGALGQVNVLAVLPAYPISLLFSYTISSSTLFNWPGIIYALAALSITVGIVNHTYAHLYDGIWMTRRATAAAASFLSPSSSSIPL